MKRDLIRITIWSILIIISLSLGTFGLTKAIVSIQITDTEKETLNQIVNNYNESEYVKGLRTFNTITSATVKNNKIIVIYSDQKEEKKYIYTYKKNNLKIEFDNYNETAWNISKLLEDAISVKNGKKETDSYLAFETIKSNKISNDDAVSVSIGDNKTEIIINTIGSLKIIRKDYIGIYETLFEKNLKNIKDFNYTYSDSNLILLLKDNLITKNINITLAKDLFTDSYFILNSLLEKTFTDDELKTFNTNYKEIKTGKLTFDKFIVTTSKSESLISINIEII